MTDSYGRYTAADYAPPASPPPGRHRRPHYGRYLILIAAVFGVTMAGVLALRGALPGVHARPASCKAQYASWKNGPAKAEAMKMITALNALQSAGASADLVLMRSDLQQAGTGARALAAYPVPACADPAGAWPQALADIRAAGDDAGTAPGLAGLLTAEVPMRKALPLLTKFGNEVKTTTR